MLGVLPQPPTAKSNDTPIARSNVTGSPARDLGRYLTIPRLSTGKTNSYSPWRIQQMFRWFFASRSNFSTTSRTLSLLWHTAYDRKIGSALARVSH